MPPTDPTEIDGHAPPFDQFKSVRPLATARSGHRSAQHARHQLYVARDKRSPTNVLVKVTSKPGLVYQQDLTNEIASLSTINRELPASPYFPVVYEHGRMHDGRVYLITSLFDEFPLATAIATERLSARMVGYLRTTLEVAKALSDMHRLGIFHVDLNPMNILHRTHKQGPVIRIVDFESSYEIARHAAGGAFYNPPTTPGYSAPEVSQHLPDARADVYSLGAVFYTMLTGFHWTWESDVTSCVAADRHLDRELKEILTTAVAVDRDRRYSSVEQLRVALAGYLEHIWPRAGRGS